MTNPELSSTMMEELNLLKKYAVNKRFTKYAILATLFYAVNKRFTKYAILATLFGTLLTLLTGRTWQEGAVFGVIIYLILYYYCES